MSMLLCRLAFCIVCLLYFSISVNVGKVTRGGALNLPRHISTIGGSKLTWKTFLAPRATESSKRTTVNTPRPTPTPLREPRFGSLSTGLRGKSRWIVPSQRVREPGPRAGSRWSYWYSDGFTFGAAASSPVAIGGVSSMEGMRGWCVATTRELPGSFLRDVLRFERGEVEWVGWCFR